LGSRVFLRTFFWTTLLLVYVLGCSAVKSEQLPVKTYTIADGLSRDYINRIKQDSHGFIWFCTNEGISRFDGYGFTNYSVMDGLPHRTIFDVLETRDGVYLFATFDGLVEFNPTATNANGSHFTSITLDDAAFARFTTRLLEDKTGNVWCTTANGLYKLTRDAGGWQIHKIEAVKGSVNSLASDHQGTLWIGGEAGVFGLFPDGRVEHYEVEDNSPLDPVHDLLVDSSDRIWAGTVNGLMLMVNDPRSNRKMVSQVFTTKDGLCYNNISVLFQSSDGRIWVGTRGGLNYLVEPTTNKGLSFRGYTTLQGLRNPRILAIAEDSDHNLWLGAESGGAMKITHAGFTSYFETDGLGCGRISQLFADRDGSVYVLADGLTNLVPVIARFDGHGFIQEQPNLPPNTELTWGWNYLIVQDHIGDWWIPTARGLFRFSGNKSFSELVTAKPAKVYTVRDGMQTNTLFRLFEDGRGDLWFSTIDSVRSNQRWERSTDKFQSYESAEDGIPFAAGTAYVNDPAGNLWVGFYAGGVTRYVHGRFTWYGEKDGMLIGFVRDMRLDSKNRLWIATNDGLVRVDDPTAETPQFIKYTTDEGLATNQVTTIVEDRWGQIYLGTGRGIDRLDPNSGKIKHYSTADGLADNFVNVSMRDAQGTLWFGTLRGLSRFVPEQDKPLLPPPIVIKSLTVAGDKKTISELGQGEVALPELNYRQNQVQVEFLSISHAPGDVLRYQYKLEGSSNDWSAPGEQRTITLANLASGSYRFLVRAINSEGTVSSQPARVSFHILPPIWLRWWFLTLAALLMITLVYVFFRYRVNRLLEIERVRTRIAADLHDDIGASLSHIAVVSEVAKMQLPEQESQLSNNLSVIARISGEAVDSMSDIVWAVNPQRDHLYDLTRRMRNFASELLSARNITFSFNVPSEEQDIRVGADVRRQIFLIFKESLNNVARHSTCTRAEIEMRIEGKTLVLKVSDNGRGFDTDNGVRGNGLRNMQKRAESLGGQVELLSSKGNGTTITLEMPHHPAHKFDKL
jgi:ligand-binding sensor domain-containing protein/two-component sensor histidine kinase